MKKSKLLAAAMAALAVGSTIIGCDEDDAKKNLDDLQVAYGPPPFVENEEYLPEEEIPEDVYGPPISEDIEEPDVEEYEPEEDEVVCMYGPPSYFESSGEEN